MFCHPEMSRFISLWIFKFSLKYGITTSTLLPIYNFRGKYHPCQMVPDLFVNCVEASESGRVSLSNGHLIYCPWNWKYKICFCKYVQSACWQHESSEKRAFIFKEVLSHGTGLIVVWSRELTDGLIQYKTCICWMQSSETGFAIKACTNDKFTLNYLIG